MCVHVCVYVCVHVCACGLACLAASGPPSHTNTHTNTHTLCPSLPPLSLSPSHTYTYTQTTLSVCLTHLLARRPVLADGSEVNLLTLASALNDKLLWVDNLHHLGGEGAIAWREGHGLAGGEGLPQLELVCLRVLLRGTVRVGLALQAADAPVDNLGQASLEQKLADVAAVHDWRGKEGVARHALEAKLHIAVQKAGLDKVLGLHGKGLWHLLALCIALDLGRLDTGKGEGDVLKGWQEEGAQGAAIADVLNHSLDGLALVLVDKGAHVLDVPLDVAHVGLLLLLVPDAGASGLGLGLGRLHLLKDLTAAAGSFADASESSLEQALGKVLLLRSAVVQHNVPKLTPAWDSVLHHKVHAAASNLLAQKLAGLPCKWLIGWLVKRKSKQGQTKRLCMVQSGVFVGKFVMLMKQFNARCSSPLLPPPPPPLTTRPQRCILAAQRNACNSTHLIFGAVGVGGVWSLGQTWAFQLGK